MLTFINSSVLDVLAESVVALVLVLTMVLVLVSVSMFDCTDVDFGKVVVMVDEEMVASASSVVSSLLLGFDMLVLLLPTLKANQSPPSCSM